MVELKSKSIFPLHILLYSLNSTNMFGLYYVPGILLGSRDSPVNKMEAIQALWICDLVVIKR